jgi:hypothetical protein
MVYNTWDYGVLGLRPLSGILKNMSDWGQLFLMYSTEQGLPHFRLRTETDPVSETLCSLEYRTIYKVQKSSNPDGRIILEWILKKYGSRIWFSVSRLVSEPGVSSTTHSAATLGNKEMKQNGDINLIYCDHCRAAALCRVLNGMCG